MIEAYKKMWTNYANFKDRTTRKDFWLAFLMNIIVAGGVGFVCGLIAGYTGENSLIFVSYLYSLAVLIPGIAIVVRRLHDVNKSGWYYFISLVPLIGGILLLIALCSDSVECDRGIQL